MRTKGNGNFHLTHEVNKGKMGKANLGFSSCFFVLLLSFVSSNSQLHCSPSFRHHGVLMAANFKALPGLKPYSVLTRAGQKTAFEFLAFVFNPHCDVNTTCQTFSQRRIMLKCLCWDSKDSVFLFGCFSPLSLEMSRKSALRPQRLSHQNFTFCKMFWLLQNSISWCFVKNVLTSSSNDKERSKKANY